MSVNGTELSIRQARQALVSRRRELQDELKRVEAAIASLDAVLVRDRPRARQSESRSPVKAEIIKILHEQGTPVHANALVESLQNRGVPLSERDPKATVVTALLRLARSGEVEALGQNMFKLAGLEAQPRLVFESSRRDEPADQLTAGSQEPEPTNRPDAG